MSAEWDIAQWSARLRGRRGIGDRQGAFDVLSSANRPVAQEGEKILFQLLRHSDLEAFDAVCRHVGRAWGLTSNELNEVVLDRVMKGESGWLKSLLENHLTQVEYGRGPSTLPSNGGWLNRLVDMVPLHGWDPVLVAIETIPGLSSGSFGTHLSKTWKDPDALPVKVAQALRDIEAKETRRRQWLVDEENTKRPPECPSHWQRSETPLTLCLRRAEPDRDKDDASTALARYRRMVEEVDLLLSLGADPSALYRGEPVILLLGSLEKAARNYGRHSVEEEEMIHCIQSAFEKMASKMQMSLPIRGSDASLSPQSVAMVFADCAAPMCARLAVAHGCPDQAQDERGLTWKMRLLAAMCLDVDPLSSDDFNVRTHRGESFLHRLLMPYPALIAPGAQRCWSPFAGPPLALMRALVEGGLSLDESDLRGNTPRQYAQGFADAELAQLDAEYLQISSNAAAPISIPTRRI